MSYSADPHEAVYIRACNYDMGVGELPSKVESLVVWGGVSANCGLVVVKYDIILF